MKSAIKISDAASIAIHAMALLAARKNETVTAPEAAKRLEVSEAHLSKVMQRLAKAGLVSSVRGPGGGFSLTRNSNKITLLEVYESIDGQITYSNCLFDTAICNSDNCVFGELLGNVNKEVKTYLSRTKLSDVAGVYNNKKRRG
ncbi:MAG: Rrf2 family transcriptional regulator [Deltaproteobacteria bacterium]|nr:Rrf2 family transcriptional regulator [Deltaproteobacteria bacterium]